MKKENNEKATLLNRYNFLIHTFCDKSSTRPELGGIFISPDHSVATDGVKMIKVDNPKDVNSDDYPVLPNKSNPLGKFNSFILPQEKAKEVLSVFNNQKKSETLPILNHAIIMKNDKDNVEIGKTDLESFNSITSRKIEGEYPKYNELFIERGKFIEISVNPKLIKEILDFYVSFIDNPVGDVKIKVPVKANEPIRFYGKRDSGQEAKAVLMPMKNS